VLYKSKFFTYLLCTYHVFQYKYTYIKRLCVFCVLPSITHMLISFSKVMKLFVPVRLQNNYDKLTNPRDALHNGERAANK